MKRIRLAISGFTSSIIGILMLALLICLIGAYINPEKIPALGLASLLIAPFMLINAFTLIYCIIRRKKTGIGVLVVLLLASPQLFNLWGFHFSSPKNKSTSTPQIKILTYNVRNFDLYNWSHNLTSRATIFESLKEIDADIISFQEFYSTKEDDWNNIQKLKETLGYEHYYFTRELVKDAKRQWGIATFSKFPIVGFGELLKETKSNDPTRTIYKAIYTDIVVQKDTIRVVNTHLASVYFNTDDYATIEHISEPEGLTIEKSKPIILKLLKAYKRRGIQVKELKSFLKNQPQPYPIILCGDFNDLPTSFAYNQLSKNLKDGFLQSGWGLGATYNGIIPGLRIDFTLVDSSFDVIHSKRIKLDISDHLPLLTTIALPPTK
jgi:endonuclease/exonuclease/phosphatase family metal-dependent hydrolase